MHFSTISLSALTGLIATVNAQSAQVNFYYDTGCQNFAESVYIDYSAGSGGTYYSGGPAGSQGGLFVNTDGDGFAYRGFTNHADGSDPFTGNVDDGECIGTLDGVYAVFIV